jgi:hypothetical protein
MIQIKVTVVGPREVSVASLLLLVAEEEIERRDQDREKAGQPGDSLTAGPGPSANDPLTTLAYQGRAASSVLLRVSSPCGPTAPPD